MKYTDDNQRGQALRLPGHRNQRRPAVCDTISGSGELQGRARPLRPGSVDCRSPHPEPGVAFDYYNAYVPEQHAPAGSWVPERNSPPVYDVPLWKDLNPRLALQPLRRSRPAAFMARSRRTCSSNRRGQPSSKQIPIPCGWQPGNSQSASRTPLHPLPDLRPVSSCPRFAAARLVLLKADARRAEMA